MLKELKYGFKMWVLMLIWKRLRVQLKAMDVIGLDMWSTDVHMYNREAFSTLPGRFETDANYTGQSSLVYKTVWGVKLFTLEVKE